MLKILLELVLPIIRRRELLLLLLLICATSRCVRRSSSERAGSASVVYANCRRSVELIDHSWVGEVLFRDGASLSVPV